MDYYRGKHCVITGGSSGIGLALAKKMAKAGANVWILARDTDKLDTAIKSIRAGAVDPNQEFGVLQADIQDEHEINDIIGAHIAEHGIPDILVNSAGVARPGYMDEMSMDLYRWMMEINFFGTVHATKAVAPSMAKRGSGVIVNMSSVAGFAGAIGDSAYCSTKFAVRGFSDAMRNELKPKGVRVVIVYPGDTDTPQLAYEKEFKPPVLEEMSKTSGIHTADSVAEAILNGVAKGRSVITPGFDVTMLFFVLNHFGNLVYPIMDFLLNQANKTLEKQAAKVTKRASD